jgi:hypothetical protein
MPLARPKLSREKDYKMIFKKITTTLSLLLAGALLTATAVAQCPGGPVPKAKLHRQSWQPESDSALLTLASSTTDPIVGYWRVQFLSGTEVIDQALTQWHSDGTEIMNSSRNPETQAFCMGVWENIGGSTYRLNHYGIAWDQSTSTTSPLGLANIRESVNLSKDGKSFRGTFIINQYDENGNLLVTLSSTLTGYRIDVTTNLKILF